MIFNSVQLLVHSNLFNEKHSLALTEDEADSDSLDVAKSCLNREIYDQLQVQNNIFGPRIPPMDRSYTTVQ
jgi:hypothetical protein